MKWTKRRTDRRRNPLIRKLHRELGADALLAHEYIIDTIAERYEGDDEHSSLKLHRDDWISEIGFKGTRKQKYKKFLTLLEFSKSTNELTFEVDGEYIDIKLIVLIEIADEYRRKIRRNSGHDPDQKRTDSIRPKEIKTDQNSHQTKPETKDPSFKQSDAEAAVAAKQAQEQLVRTGMISGAILKPMPGVTSTEDSRK